MMSAKTSPPGFDAALRAARFRRPDEEDVVDEYGSGRIGSTPWHLHETAGSDMGAESSASYADGYFTAGDDEEDARARPIEIVDVPAIAEPKSLDPADIRIELGLDGCRSVNAMRQARRAFARLNHPDRVHATLRDNATARMTIANRLIDDEIRIVSLQSKTTG